MKTIIVPVDFSDTSANAARYAAGLALQVKAETVILYNTYIANWQISEVGVETVHQTAYEGLQNLARELKTINPTVNYELIADNNYLYGGVEHLVTEYRAELVVMGITGRGNVEQKLVGTNTTRFALKSSAPVLIIPPDATYEKIEKVVMCIDFVGGLLDHMPAEKVKRTIRELDAALTLLYIDNGNVNLTKSDLEGYSGVQAAHLMFDEVNADIEVEQGKDIPSAVAQYAFDHKAQIVASVTMEHSFLDKIFKGSVTRKLAFYVNIPLLVFREKKIDDEAANTHE